jgi:2-phosphoglycerate kinase
MSGQANIMSNTEGRARSKKIIVKKRSGRLEPFDSRKMARATSRAGVPYPIALEIAKTIRNSEFLAKRRSSSNEDDTPVVSSVTLRRMVTEELIKRGQETAAKSYHGYKKIKGARKEKFERSLGHKSKVSKSVKSHAKQRVKDKDNTGGRPPRW